MSCQMSESHIDCDNSTACGVMVTVFVATLLPRSIRPEILHVFWYIDVVHVRDEQPPYCHYCNHVC